MENYEKLHIKIDKILNIFKYRGKYGKINQI